MANVETHSVLLTFGAVCLLCGVIGTFIHPELPPSFESLRRSEVRLSRAAPGRHHCGRPGQPLMGHAGGWVLGAMFGDREHCFVVYPASAEQARLLESLPALAEVVARHTEDRIWQLETGQGVLMSYEAKLAEAQDAWESRRWAQAVFWGIGLVLFGSGLSLRRKARNAEPSTRAA